MMMKRRVGPLRALFAGLCLRLMASSCPPWWFPHRRRVDRPHNDAAVHAYRHTACTRAVSGQFQFPGCYVPSLAPDLLLSEAGFLLSHDAATGYLRPTQGLNGATNLYAKNQVGTVYRQLDDGARALDVRPKLLSNGTLVTHHGSVTIPTTMEKLVRDARAWCNDNPDELVLILHHDLVHPWSSGSTNTNATTTTAAFTAEDAVDALSALYSGLGVPYVACDDVAGLTVGDTMELAALASSGDGSGGAGYLLAMDRHDAYASSCAKLNYVEALLVTCYPPSNGSGSSSSSSSSSSGNKNVPPPCTAGPASPQYAALREYASASANNEPSDRSDVLGPPASTSEYPFFEVQALWQVDARSAAAGVAHFSSLIDDNTKSRLNAQVVEWVHGGDTLRSVSLLAVDQVRLNGNALLSVLRNRCGQSVLSFPSSSPSSSSPSSVSPTSCGTALAIPRLQGQPMSTLSFVLAALLYAAFGVWMAVLLAHYRRYYNHQEQMRRMERDVRAAAYRCDCRGEGGDVPATTPVPSPGGVLS